MKFNENLPSGSRVFPCRQAIGQADISDVANSQFSQF